MFPTLFTIIEEANGLMKSVGDRFDNNSYIIDSVSKQWHKDVKYCILNCLNNKSLLRDINLKRLTLLFNFYKINLPKD